MEEDEAALLAELRAISNKSAADRFADDTEEQPTTGGEKAAAQQADGTTMPDESVGFGFKSDAAPSTFQGERGGSAEDAELLALLRGVSSKSASASRFADDNNNVNEAPTSSAPEEPVVAAPLRRKANSDELPPWKRASRNKNAKQPDVEVVVAAPAPTTATGPTALPVPQEASPMPDESVGFSIKSSVPSTFQGERGGSAEDAELLALLRGVSSSASRFADEGDTTIATTPAPAAPVKAEPTAVAKPKKKAGGDELPPWKRGAPKNPVKQPKVEVVVSAPAPPPAIEPGPEKPAPLPDESVGFGLKSDVPSSFQGERGGSAEDAELLALLRGVSSKSSSASRFADENDTSVSATPARAAPTESVGTEVLPPWKRGARAKPTKQPDVDVVVAAPRPAQPSPVHAAEVTAPLPDESIGLGIKPDIPSSFQGERGGSAEDSELLALLRGISSQSSSASRFADENDNDVSKAPAPAAPTEPVAPSKPKKGAERNELPPWKREARKNPAKQPDADVVVAAPPAAAPSVESAQEASAPIPHESVGFGIKSDIPRTFQGERGGNAEDAELLALLRGVSTKSSSASRFADEGEANVSATPAPAAPVGTEPVPASKPKKKAARNEIPPWRLGGKPMQRDMETLVATPSAPAPVPPSKAIPDESLQMPDERVGFGIKQDVPSTFKGERGGSAEDAELLALLRGVSSKSSSASRFADDGDNGARDAPRPPHTEPKQEKVGGERLPPWKRGARIKPEKQGETEVIAAAPPSRPPVKAAVATEEDSPMVDESVGFGLKSTGLSTFQGERGGTAEDAELLALLRGVSSKSSGTSRFSDGNNENGGDNGSGIKDKALAPIPADEGRKRGEKTDTAEELPPWKRGVQKKPESNATVQAASTQAHVTASLDEGVVDETVGYGIETGANCESTFQGERGGAAEDAELLALLRGVSTKSGGARRFVDEAPTSEQAPPPARREPAAALPVAPREKPTKSTGLQENTSDEIVLSRGDLPGALRSKDWKMRSKAFELLQSILLESVGDRHSSTSAESDSVMEGLDALVINSAEETHVATLDKVLQFALTYAEHCHGAGEAENAKAIVSALIRKNGFSSRPTTLKLATSLTLKLMEVGRDGTSSLQSITETVLADGLTSRKPKVVQTSSTLLLEAMYDFGAVNFPLASMTASLPKLLSHSNAKVRETGVSIVAELCRVLGSKAAIQDVIDSMRKAQVSQLDSLLTEQPQPTPPRTVLRGLGSSSTSSDAVATLAVQAKQLEAERFASRPAVDLLSAIAATDYASRIALQKWSEKVAGLKIVLECAGEKPYKLAQPSPAVNYGPLISDMKKLLAHTHFAVCGKAMEVLSMLAEGVGEKLFPYLRPLLTSLLQLSKDKKLTKSVSSCLDTFFGNILSFDHLLDEEDGIPLSVDDKKQKNALARASALEFLGRCVERNASAGPRGTLKVPHAERSASLCVQKLKDSDASVRKAATGVLLLLKKPDDPQVFGIVSGVIESLKNSNPRAYKMLTKTKSGTEKPTASETNISVQRGVKNEAKPQHRQPPVAGRLTEVQAVPAEQAHSSASSTNGVAPGLEDSTTFVATLGIPQWNAPEDDGGVLTGLLCTFPSVLLSPHQISIQLLTPFTSLHSASKWHLRQNSIKAIVAFLESGQIDGASIDVKKNTSCLLVVVKEHTRGFKETNVNIMKAILKLFTSMCEYHEAKGVEFEKWATLDGVAVATQKISDRKLSSSCKELLTRLCVVVAPSAVLEALAAQLKSVKSPVVHEESLRWFKAFCTDFGAHTLGSRLSSLVPWILDVSLPVTFRRPLQSMLVLIFWHFVHRKCAHPIPK